MTLEVVLAAHAIMYYAEPYRLSAVSPSWNDAIRTLVGKTWEEFWLADFNWPAVLEQNACREFEKRLQRIMEEIMPKTGLNRWWCEVQLALSFHCGKQSSSPMKIALHQCDVLGMNYDFMRHRLQQTVSDERLKAEHFKKKRVVHARHLGCDHCARTMLEVIDTLVFVAKNDDSNGKIRVCGCHPSRSGCTYSDKRIAIQRLFPIRGLADNYDCPMWEEWNSDEATWVLREYDYSSEDDYSPDSEDDSEDDYSPEP